MTSTEHQDISGTVTKVKHYSPDRGFHVLSLSPDDGREPICVTFKGPRIYAGQHAEIRGTWETNEPFGNQFKATRVVAKPPRTPAGTQTYLASGVLTGMGEQIAGRAVERFGNVVFDILTDEPERLAEIRGVSKKKALAWGEAWKKIETGRRDAMSMLTSHGLTANKAGKVHDVYDRHTEAVVTTNPYDVSKNVRGVGFSEADNLALKLGVGADSPFRITACLQHILTQSAKTDGHTGLHRDTLTKRAATTLSLTEPEIEAALTTAVAAQEFIAADLQGRPGVFVPELYRAEANIARHLREISDGPSPWARLDVEETIAWVAPRLKHQPNDMQVAAIRQILSGKITILTGGPGTGKTFVLEAIALIAKRERLALRQCALAGRAAQNMTEKTGMPADTIHMTLGQTSKGFTNNSEKPLTARILVLDEASMVSIKLAWSLIQAISVACAVIFVGDVDQLEPIGAGNFFEDLIESGAIPTIRLTQITRQGANSNIIVNAHRMNQGLMPLEDPTAPGQDFFFIETQGGEKVVSQVVELITTRIPSRFAMDPIKDTLVLSPMKKGRTGTNALNEKLKQSLNRSPNEAITSRGIAYQAGDKVMQTKNDYELDVRNGELGMIETIDVDKDKVTLRFARDKIVEGDSGLIATLLHGYAVTGHKSQGSEFPAVVIVITMDHFVMLRRRLVYTMHTRGKRLVIFVGQRKALKHAIENTNSVRRLTKFKDWMRLAFDVPAAAM